MKSQTRYFDRFTSCELEIGTPLEAENEHTEQTLEPAIGELRCIRPGVPATIDELHALTVAQESVGELLRSCVAQLRFSHSWDEIAETLGCSPRAARLQYGRTFRTPAQEVGDFWDECRDRFAWPFLPNELLHLAYLAWVRENPSDEAPLRPKAFARLLRVRAESSNQWAYTRARVGARSVLDGSLAKELGYEAPGSAVYGLRRL